MSPSPPSATNRTQEGSGMLEGDENRNTLSGDVAEPPAAHNTVPSPTPTRLSDDAVDTGKKKEAFKGDTVSWDGAVIVPPDTWTASNVNWSLMKPKTPVASLSTVVDCPPPRAEEIKSPCPPVIRAEEFPGRATAELKPTTVGSPETVPNDVRVVGSRLIVPENETRTPPVPSSTKRTVIAPKADCARASGASGRRADFVRRNRWGNNVFFIFLMFYPGLHGLNQGGYCRSISWHPSGRRGESTRSEEGGGSPEWLLLIRHLP